MMAHSSRTIRAHLCRQGIAATIPAPADRAPAPATAWPPWPRDADISQAIAHRRLREGITAPTAQAFTPHQVQARRRSGGHDHATAG